MQVAKAKRVPFKDLGPRVGEVYLSAVDAPRIGAIFSGLPGAALLKSRCVAFRLDTGKLDWRESRCLRRQGSAVLEALH